MEIFYWIEDRNIKIEVVAILYLFIPSQNSMLDCQIILHWVQQRSLQLYSVDKWTKLALKKGSSTERAKASKLLIETSSSIKDNKWKKNKTLLQK